MNQVTKQKCIEIIDELLKHPISEVFSEPVDPKIDGVPDYFDIISHPSDFSTVKNKLIEGAYKTVDEFKFDVNLIWENAITYNTKQSLPAYIADELSRLFQKRLRYLETPQLEQWTNDFLKARSTVCRLFRNPPSGLVNASFSTDASNSADGDKSRQKLTTDDVQFFQSVHSQLNDKSKSDDFERIIHEIEPDFSYCFETIESDLEKMLPRTRRGIKNYLMKIQVNQDDVKQ